MISESTDAKDVNNTICGNHVSRCFIAKKILNEICAASFHLFTPYAISAAVDNDRHMVKEIFEQTIRYRRSKGAALRIRGQSPSSERGLTWPCALIEPFAERNLPFGNVLGFGCSFLGPLVAGPLRHKHLLDFPSRQPCPELLGSDLRAGCGKRPLTSSAQPR
jgi:hypothetical protein